MKRTVVYEEGMLLGACMCLVMHVACITCHVAGDLELMTGTSRCSDCISSGNGVFCSLLLIPSEVSWR